MRVCYESVSYDYVRLRIGRLAAGWPAGKKAEVRHVHSGNVLFPRTASALGEVGIPGAALLHTDLTTSTQDDLAELWLSSAGAHMPGLMCGLIADSQSDGRGRMGRSWFATKDGSLLFSVLLAVPEAVRAELSWVTFAGALAARAALEKLGARVGISWPNDIVTRPRAAKVAGVLGEVVSTDAAGNIGIVLGVGINLGLRAEELPTPTSASLATAGFPVPSRDEVAAAYLHELGERLAALMAACGSGEGSAAERAGLLAELNASCDTLRAGITVNRPRDTPVRGRGVHIVADGALVVATAAGDVRISTGEVSLVGRLAPSEGK